jgi:hypothetical protein
MFGQEISHKGFAKSRLLKYAGPRRKPSKRFPFACFYLVIVEKRGNVVIRGYHEDIPPFKVTKTVGAALSATRTPPKIATAYGMADAGMSWWPTVGLDAEGPSSVM